MRATILFLLTLVPIHSVMAQSTAPSSFVGASPSIVPQSPTSVKPAEFPSGRLDLQQAIEIALAHNHDVAAAAWDATAAQARYDQAAGERLPRLGVTGGYAHHLDEQRLLPAGVPGDPFMLSRDIFAGDMVITMPLFTGGRLINQVKAAELLQTAAEQRLNRSKEELAFNVSSVFYSILAQRQVIESLEFAGRTLVEHLKRVDALVAAQKVARVDRLRTEVRLADVKQRLVREKNLLAIQCRVLANLLGLDDRIDAVQLQGDLSLEQNVSVPEQDEALATAWSDRDDYHAAQAALEAQARNVAAAGAGHLPSIYLQGSYGERWAAGQTTGRGHKTDDIGRIGIAVDLPLFEGGRVNARVREQRAALSAARERLAMLELRIRLDVETALLNVNSARERIEALQKAVDQAQEGFRIESEKYELGKGAIVDVLDAQAALLEAQTNYHRALADFHTALAQLRFATGEII